jgi:LysR substrate binding domain
MFEGEASKALEHSLRAVPLVHALKREKDQKLRIGLSTLCDLPRLWALVETARRSAEEVAVEYVTAYTPELLLVLHRGRLDLAVLDLPIRSRGAALFPIPSEPLIAVPHAIMRWHKIGWLGYSSWRKNISQSSLGREILDQLFRIVA